MRYADFIALVRGLVFVDTEAENLVTPHNFMFQEALGEIQKWVPQERDINVNVIPFCASFFKCGLTVVDRPLGEIKRLYTIANGNWCNPVLYWRAMPRDPESWARNYLFYMTPTGVGQPSFPLGFQKADPITDRMPNPPALSPIIANVLSPPPPPLTEGQFPWLRAQIGIWAVVDNNIQIAPWIMSNESVVIEWRGKKDNWTDDDIVPDRINFRNFVKCFVAFAHERDFGTDPAIMERTQAAKELAMADLIYEWNEYDRIKNDKPFKDERDRLPQELNEGNLPAAQPTSVGLALYCDGMQADLAAIINGWAPANIVTAGGNSYSGNYDQDVGQFFASFIKPYSGAYGAGGSVNAFWPSPNATDWANGSNLAPYEAFFNPPNNGRYYEVCLGAAHFFMLDAVSNEPDGIGVLQAQAQWLKAKMTLSTARWKIVVGAALLPWPFDQWGANVVIYGGLYYERSIQNGVMYIGLPPAFVSGGNPGAPLPGSVIQWGGHRGAMQANITMTSAQFTLISQFNTQIDTVTLT